MKTCLVEVVIFGLWGIDSEIRLPIDPQFNFIIGKNGTGKTTVINLIAAALTADFDRLDKIQFKRIVLTLKAKESKKKPSIEVSKKQKPDLPYFDIAYRIKDSAVGPAKAFDLDALAEERAFRGVPPRVLRDRHIREKFLYVQRELENLIQVSWLSVHRQSEESRPNEERRIMTAVDQKLIALNDVLVRYFSKTDRAFADETLAFQQASFLSLLKIQRIADIRSFVKLIDINAEKKSLASVFELLGVSEDKYSRQLQQIVQQFVDAKAPFLENKGFTMENLLAIGNSFKAHSLVQLYEALQQKRKEIFEPINKFLEVINGLFAPRKQVSISARNELIIRTSTGAHIDLVDLSSGEKQLLIILGQALLQESSSVVYIADEPELSLHVEWQERLTSSIMKINPNAQIVFATHSPDIVGAQTDRIIDMETVLA